MAQRINEQIGILAAIEAKRHFFAVGLEMLRANFVPSSEDAALQERESRFYGISVDVALHVDAELVANSFVASILSEMTRCAAVGIKIIGVKNFDILADIFADVLFECSALYIFGMEEAEVAATLTDSNYDLFVVVSRLLSFSTVYAADKRFVHLHSTAKHWLIGFDHCGADSMAEIPCRPIASDSEGALNLTSGHPLLCFAEQQCGNEPFCKGKVRIVKDSSSGNGKLIIAFLTVEQLLLGIEFHDWHFAAQTLWAFGPAQADKHFSTLFIGREHAVYIN
jgi:hypothetical protein